MNHLLRNIILFSTVLFLFSGITKAQQDTSDVEIVRLELKDGSTLIGHILDEDENMILIKTLTELEIKVPKQSILQKEIIKGEIEQNEFWHDDPNQTRMFFAPTGKSLKQGKGYFAVYEIFFPFITVGVTDWFTLAGGMTLIPGASSQVFYIAPKITPLTSQNVNASVGVLYLAIPDEAGAGIAYSVVTFGSNKGTITLGLGFGFSGEDFREKPILVLGGELRLSRSTKLLTENWIIPSGEINIFSFGLRFFGENLAADFGLLFSSESTEGFPFLPWIGFAYNF